MCENWNVPWMIRVIFGEYYNILVPQTVKYLILVLNLLYPLPSNLQTDIENSATHLVLVLIIR